MIVLCDMYSAIDYLVTVCCCVIFQVKEAIAAKRVLTITGPVLITLEDTTQNYQSGITACPNVGDNTYNPICDDVFTATITSSEK